MYTEEFLELTGPLGESERIYRRMYDLRENPAELERYKRELPQSTIDRLDLFIPGRGKWYDCFEESDYIFSCDTDIVLQKHNCYTPEFEHSHTYFEIIYVYRGYCSNQVGSRRLRLGEGDFCFIMPGQTHSLLVDSESIIINIMVKKSTFLNTFFENMDGESILSRFFYQALVGDEKSGFLIFHTGTSEYIPPIIADMFMEYYWHRKYFSKILNGLLLVLFSLVVRRHAEQAEAPMTLRDDRQFVEILLYIQQHYYDLSLRQVAEKFHYSASHLSRMLKRHTGKSYVELIRECRLQKSCQLMKGTRYTIADISSIVGYPNVEHFNRIFRKEYGISPGEWRKKEAEEDA